MPDDRRDGAVPEGGKQAQLIADQIEHPIGSKIAVIIDLRAGGASVAALVWSYDMISGRSERRHHLAPAIG